MADWDRKTWSAQNYFSTPGESVDVGNFILATMFLAIRHALGMESPIDRHQQDELDSKGSHCPAPWESEQCTRHPIVSGAATAGMARKEGYVQAIANLTSRDVPPEGLRVVIETLVQDEVGHQVSLGTQISDKTCELLDDVLEAAGGLLCPYIPVAKPFMKSMHKPHGIDFTNDGDAFHSLQALAQSIKELAGMLPTPKADDGSPGDNRARMWSILKEIRPDSFVLDPRYHRDCWVCGEITRLGGKGFLNEEGHAPALQGVPDQRRKKSGKRARTGRARSKGARLKPRRAWARDRSRGSSRTRIIQRTPPIIFDTRLNDTQNKGTYRCDGCEEVYHGPFQGEFIEDTRNLSYADIASGWKHEAVDASWFCIGCWKEKLGLDSEDHTREVIGFPMASRPLAIRDNRFHQHSSRWCLCDNCDCYCTGRARD